MSTGKQPSQLYNMNGYPVLTGETNSNCPCLTHQVKIQVGLRVPTPSLVRHGAASCGLLVLPQEDFPALTSSTYSCAGSLGRRDCVSMAAEGFACFVCVHVCVHAHVCMCSCTSQLYYGNL